jgi:hypothetical protein
MARITTRVADYSVLKDILKEMGFDLVEGHSTVKAMDGKSHDVIARVKGKDVGIAVLEDGTHQLVGEFWRTDWYGKEDKLAKKINHGYGVQKTQKELKAKGYQLKPGSLKTLPDGSTVFVMAKY